MRRVRCMIVATKDVLLQQNYSEVAIDSFYETFVELLDGLFDYSMDDLIKLFQDESSSNCYTWYMRLLTACSLRKSVDKYLPFIEDAAGAQYNHDMELYCRSEVEPLGKECEQVHIMALIELWGNLRVIIAYLDGRDLVQDKLHEVVLESSYEGRALPCESKNESIPTASSNSDHRQNSLRIIRLLYRPGHYDMVYT